MGNSSKKIKVYSLPFAEAPKAEPALMSGLLFFFNPFSPSDVDLLINVLVNRYAPNCTIYQIDRVARIYLKKASINILVLIIYYIIVLPIKI